MNRCQICSSRCLLAQTSKPAPSKWDASTGIHLDEVQNGLVEGMTERKKLHPQSALRSLRSHRSSPGKEQRMAQQRVTTAAYIGSRHVLPTARSLPFCSKMMPSQYLLLAEGEPSQMLGRLRLTQHLHAEAYHNTRIRILDHGDRQTDVRHVVHAAVFFWWSRIQRIYPSCVTVGTEPHTAVVRASISRSMPRAIGRIKLSSVLSFAPISVRIYAVSSAVPCSITSATLNSSFCRAMGFVAADDGKADLAAATARWASDTSAEVALQHDSLVAGSMTGKVLLSSVANSSLPPIHEGTTIGLNESMIYSRDYEIIKLSFEKNDVLNETGRT